MTSRGISAMCGMIMFLASCTEKADPLPRNPSNSETAQAQELGSPSEASRPGPMEPGSTSGDPVTDATSRAPHESAPPSNVTVPEKREAPATLSLDLGNEVWKVQMQLVLIPAGEFMMGSRESAAEVFKKMRPYTGLPEEEYFACEHPRHLVKITRPFYMGKYEVTQNQYMAIMGIEYSHSAFQNEDNPAEQVPWNHAMQFCQKLSQRASRRIRLPTEAEWEYACRAGTTTAFNFADELNPPRANFNARMTYPYVRPWRSVGSRPLRPMPVGSFEANGWGLYDMHGNVFEWCSDYFDPGYYAASPSSDPTGPAKGKTRVIRGGSWKFGGYCCRSAYRDRRDAVIHHDNIGFRVVAEVSEH